MSLEMAHKVILPPKKNYIPQFLKQRDINSYYVQQPSRLPIFALDIHVGRLIRSGILLFSITQFCDINAVKGQGWGEGSMCGPLLLLQYALHMNLRKDKKKIQHDTRSGGTEKNREELQYIES
jgi:hypothetical protein